MKKDAYYFPHYCNARNDSKIVKLRRVLGIEGYGIYFLLLEILREQTEFILPISIVEDLAYEWHVSKEKIESVICNFDLFDIENGYFMSKKLVLYLQPYIEKSQRARDAANTRWSNANAYANALPEHSASNASKGKESKVKERKVNKEKRGAVVFPFDSNDFKKIWGQWKNYKDVEHKFKYKSTESEQAALMKLTSLASGSEDMAAKIIMQSMENGWKGFFELKNNKPQQNGQPDYYEEMARRMVIKELSGNQ